MEKAMASHSSTLAWKIPWAEEPGRLQFMGSQRIGHDWATSLSLFTFLHWRRKWQPTPVFLPGESQGRGSLVGCCLCGRRVGHDWSNLAAAAAYTWKGTTDTNAQRYNVYTSVQFSCSAVSDSLWPHGLQHARLPWPSNLGACSNSHPSSQWCHPTISSSVILFSSCLQSFPASVSFPMSQFFTSGGQSIGVSASASVLPMNIQDWFPLGGLVWSPCSPRNSQESSLTLQFKTSNSSALSFLYGPTFTCIHDYWKNHSLD